MVHKNLWTHPWQFTSIRGSDELHLGQSSMKGFTTTNLHCKQTRSSDFNCSSSVMSLSIIQANVSYITICETRPPIEKATIQVPIQIMTPSLIPRSFIITIKEAIQGTKSVIVKRATVICIGAK